MRAVEHMRGNTILEACHVNDTFALEYLARALIKEGVAVTGAFVKVE
jgi:hypothetical protein